MTNPYRALCAELTDAELANAARKALGEPSYATELHYFLSEDSNEYEPLMLAIRAGIAADRARALLAQPVPQPPADGEVAELQRWGVDHGAQPGRPLLSPMEDGYWTPWHIAADLLQRLASDNAGLEAAAESLFWDNLSLLDSQND